MPSPPTAMTWRLDGCASFEALFDHYYPRIYQLLYCMVGDEASDLAQEVFLRLYERPPTGETLNVGAWLYRVANRMGLNALRGRRRWESYRDALGLETQGAGWSPERVDPALTMERQVEREAVRETLRKLSRRHATLLSLRYGGLTYREIAEVAGVAPASVGTLLARAERAFLRRYEELFGERSKERAP